MQGRKKPLGSARGQWRKKGALMAAAWGVRAGGKECVVCCVPLGETVTSGVGEGVVGS